MQTQFAFQRASLALEPTPRAQPHVDRSNGERERPPAAPEPEARGANLRLLIARNWRYAHASRPATPPPYSGRGTISRKNIKTPADWAFGLLFALAALAFVFAIVRSWLNPQLRRYLVLDDFGLTVFAPQNVSLAWSQLEGCARGPTAGRILESFCGQTGTSLARKTSGAETYFDLDFRLANRPERSRDLVFRACIDRLGVECDFSEETDPLRLRRRPPAR